MRHETPSDRLQNNQETAFARGATDQDVYRIMALGLQIDVGAPRFFNTAAKEVDLASSQVGQVLTYTVHVDNSLGTADANDVLFTDEPPVGTTLVPGSVRVDGAIPPTGDQLTDLPLGTIAQGEDVDVTFQVTVVSVPNGPTANIRSNKARWTFTFVSCAGQPPLSGAAESNTVTTNIPVADLSITKGFLAAPAVAGAPVSYRITVRNAGPSGILGAVIQDSGTTPALTAPTWTCTPESAGSSCSAASESGALTRPPCFRPVVAWSTR